MTPVDDTELSALQITLVYAFTAAMWIVLSDLFLADVLNQTAKGLGFVAVSSAVLLLVLSREHARRRRALAQLQESERRYASAERLGRMGHWEVDLEAETLLWSDEIYRIFEIEKTDFDETEEAFFSFVHPDDRESLRRARETALAGHGLLDERHRIVTGQGNVRWVRERATIEFDDDLEPISMHGTVQDITEQVEQERLRERDAERIRALSRQATIAQEEERQRIARELHDEFGQSLTGLTFGLRALQEGADEEDREVLEQLDSEVKRMMTSLGEIVAKLRPELLDQFGLAAALEQLCETWSDRFDTRCIIDSALDESDWTPAPRESIHVFRIVQEALTNIARHAEATSVDISLEHRDDEVFLQVRDDGRGFASDDARGSLGLQGMRERAAMLGGELDIDSSDEGTTITLRAPLERDGAGPEDET